MRKVKKSPISNPYDISAVIYTAFADRMDKDIYHDVAVHVQNIVWDNTGTVDSATTSLYNKEVWDTGRWHL